MAAIHMFLGDKVKQDNIKILQNQFDKRVVEFLYEFRNTDLNGKFISAAAYTGPQLWTTLSEALKLKPDVKPMKVTGGAIDRPGTYPLEIEGKGYLFRGKIVFKRAPGDKTTPQIKRNSSPAKVILKSAGANTSSFPKELKRDMDDLIKEMKKPANYSFTGTTSAADKGWGAKFGKHYVHLDPGSGTRKTYVDSITNSTGTTWRMYFDVEFNYTTQALTVSLTKLANEHQ